MGFAAQPKPGSPLAASFTCSSLRRQSNRAIQTPSVQHRKLLVWNEQEFCFESLCLHFLVFSFLRQQWTSWSLEDSERGAVRNVSEVSCVLALSFQYLRKTGSSCEKSSLQLLIPTGLKVPCGHLNLLSLLPWQYHLSSSAFQGTYMPATVTFSFSVRPSGTRMIWDNRRVTQYMVQCSNRDTSLCSHRTNLINSLPGDFCKCNQWATQSLTGASPGQGKAAALCLT